MGFRLALVLAVILIGCSESQSPSEIQEESSGVEREIRGFTLTETLEGVLNWELEADVAWRIPNDQDVHLKNVTLLFYDADGKVNSRLTALTGTVNEESGIMTARERVRVVSSVGDTLTTEELTYNKETERIAGPGFVRLAKPDRILTGLEFESDPDLSNYEIHRDVTITIVNGLEEGSTRP